MSMKERKFLPVFSNFFHRLRARREKKKNRKEGKVKVTYPKISKKEQTIRFHIQNTLELAYQKIYQLNQQNENWVGFLQDSLHQKENDAAANKTNFASTSTLSPLSSNHISSSFTEIPLIIHQTYKSLDTLPDRWKETPESWQQTHPTWEYKFWSDQDCRLLIEKDFYWFLPFYDSYPHFIQRVDAWRFFALYKHGGVYVDMDLRAKMSNSKNEKEDKKNLSELFDRVQKINGLKESPDMFLLQDPFGYLMDEHAPWKTSECGFVRITNCFIASKPRHPLLLLGIKLLCERALVSQSLLRGKKWWSLRKDVLVLHSTGPGIWTELYRRYRLNALNPAATANGSVREAKPCVGKNEKTQRQAIKREKRATRRTLTLKDAHRLPTISSSHQPSLSLLWKKFFQKTVPNSFSNIENSNASEMRLSAALLTTISRRPDHVAVIPSTFFFPVVCYFLSEKPCSLPSTYAVQLEGHSWIQSKWDKKITNYVLQICFWFQTMKNKELSNQILEEIEELEEYQKSIQTEVSSPARFLSSPPTSLLDKNSNFFTDVNPSSSRPRFFSFFERKNKIQTQDKKKETFDHKFFYLKRFLSSKPVQAFLSQKSALLERKKEKFFKSQHVLFSENRTWDSPIAGDIPMKRGVNPAGISRFLTHYQAEPLVFRPFRHVAEVESCENVSKLKIDPFFHPHASNAQAVLRPFVVSEPPEQISKKKSFPLPFPFLFRNQHKQEENNKKAKGQNTKCNFKNKIQIQKSFLNSTIYHDQKNNGIVNETFHYLHPFFLFWILFFYLILIKLR